MSTICPDTRPQRPRGFAIASAIFILVVLAALAAFIVSVTATQSLTFAQDIQGARAYQAARAGAEWGIARWLGNTPSLPANCPDTIPTGATGTLNFAEPGPSGFTTTVRTALTTTAGVRFCTIEATAVATGATVGSHNYVERQVRAVVEGN
ncbi:MAG: hypothetical protein Q8M20_15840 [Rhodocyclaceae bacterium]|nr:hypothetical protein [Rhodocyclaceae bacterium]MDZ4215220.1 hypothetical protein [Rhodocyclaceae bacterium]